MYFNGFRNPFSKWLKWGIKTFRTYSYMSAAILDRSVKIKKTSLKKINTFLAFLEIITPLRGLYGGSKHLGHFTKVEQQF